MRRHLLLAIASWVIVASSMTAQASWVFRRSSYTHDPASGERVAQYAPKETRYVRTDPTYQQSVYLHNRSTLHVGQSADRMHMVESWGKGESIRPYGEWEYPYRAGATPYGPWGNPRGPWTTPHGAWVNPYGLGQLPYPPLGYGYGPYPPLHGGGFQGYPAIPGDEAVGDLD